MTNAILTISHEGKTVTENYGTLDEANAACQAYKVVLNDKSVVVTRDGHRFDRRAGSVVMNTGAATIEVQPVS